MARLYLLTCWGSALVHAGSLAPTIPEDFSGSRPLTFQEVRTLMDELFGQGCNQCGKIDKTWLDNGQRSYTWDLKVDYRKKGSVCAQRCIGPSTDLGLGINDEYNGSTYPSTGGGEAEAEESPRGPT